MSALQHPIALALGWTLLHALWQCALVGFATALLVRLLRRASAQTRHLAACAGLLACLSLPAITLARLWPAAEATTVQLMPPADLLPAPAGRAPTPAPPPSLAARAERLLRPGLPWIAGGWALGTLLCLLRLLGGWMWLQRLRRHGTRPAPREWQARLTALTHRLGLSHCPELRLCDGMEGPLAHGWWRPAVLLPASLLTGMDPVLLEALLAHELAHIRRQDYLANLLQSLAETLLFFHPAVWWISARIRTTREEACDDLAAMAIGEPRRLALALAELDRFQFPEPAPNLALGAHQGDLMTRITRLLHPVQPRPILGGLLPALLAAAFLTPLMASSAPPVQTIPATAILRPAELVAQIDALAAKEGIDRHLLRAIAEVESQYDPKAVSPLGSLGLLQVRPETARRYGAQDLNDPSQVLAAGARYLKHLLERYNGDTTKAVAAYNGGEEALEAGALNEETRRYVPSVLQLAQAKAVQPEPTPSSQAAPSSEKQVLKVPKGESTVPRHIHMARHGELLELDLDVTRQELTALLAEHWNWLFATGVEDRVLDRTLPPFKSAGEVGLTLKLKRVGPVDLLRILGKYGWMPAPLSAAWLKQLPPGTASGELKPLPGGEWDVRMQILALDGFEVEFRVEGQAKPIGSITVGSRNSARREILRDRSQPRIRMAISPKTVVVRVTEHGTGRWGETTVDLGQEHPSFRISLDMERKNP